MIEIDKDRCIGCGICASTYPEIFEIDEEGKSNVKSSPDEFIDIDICPIQAIKIIREKN